MNLDCCDGEVSCDYDCARKLRTIVYDLRSQLTAEQAKSKAITEWAMKMRGALDNALGYFLHEHYHYSDGGDECLGPEKCPERKQEVQIQEALALPLPPSVVGEEKP